MRTVRFGLIGLLGLLFIATLARPAAAADGQLVCHFLVIHTPAATDGGEAAVDSFKVELARLAGGFTSLGRAGGAMVNQTGQLETDDHEALMVTADKDLTKEIRRLGKTVLKRDNMYLITWPVSGGYLPNQ